MADPDYKIDLDFCPTPVLLVDKEGRIVRTNSRLSELFGYQRSELVGQSVEVLVPQRVRDYHPELRTAYFETPTNRAMGTGRDLHGVRKDGELLPVEIGLDPIEFNDQPMVMVSVLDIRERKKSEAVIRRALNAASSAMIQVNSDGVIELVNDKAVQLFGYTTKELLGHKIEMLVPERLRRKHTVYRVSYDSDREARNMGSGRDLFGVRSDGTEFPIEIGLTPIHELDGRSTMATIIDISDRKARERHIKEKNDQLESLNSELLQFAYSASHDLKAPLTSITGLLQCCSTDLADGNYDEVRENLDVAASLSSRLAQRIEDMLALAKSDRLREEPQATTIAVLVNDTWNALTHENVRFTTQFEHQDPVITVPTRLAIVLENLLTNAVKYRCPEPAECEVEVSTKDEDGQFVITVTDNGIGIPKEHHDKVFQMFQRFADTDEPGSGLGLALVKKQVTILGGTVEFSSADGITHFRCRLPRDLQLPTENPDATEPQ